MVHSPHLSFVIPVFNEQKNLLHLHSAVQQVLHSDLLDYSYEFIFVDDGSVDGSWSILQELAAASQSVTAIRFTRNFGHQAALTAGYKHARGEAIITLDADMQDPPEVITRMVREWYKGAAIVYARRRSRDDSFIKKHTARLFYIVLDHVSEVHMPRNVGDFRLIDKKVLAVINQCPERARYLRGMVAWTGFKSAFVDFDRPDRHAGNTGYTWAKMFKLAFDGLTSFSLFPLKIAAFVGALVVMTGALMFAYITFDTVLFGKHYPLFKWLVTVMYIFMGVQFFLLWLLGEYIGRMYDQIKERPLYVLQEVLNGNRESIPITPHHKTDDTIQP